MIKTVRIENASKWRLCSRTERRPSGSPNPISTVQNEDQWVTRLSSNVQVDRPTDEAGSDLWWNLGSEEKNWIFLSNFKKKMVVLPFLSLFFYLWWLQKIGRRRRKKMIFFLALLYKGLRGLKFWALNLGLPHEEKPNKHGDGWGLSWRYGPVVQFGTWALKVARWKRGCDDVMKVLGWWYWWSDDHGVC